ncbi:LysR family transcriptional regulator [Mesorhizobium sp. IMUNJ 23232]|uniref:LysR family transcriptional regulator n=1 Tax=Mesorhizobium sp. IMUNJ 23232 TaxID=3376064 RepID=UPI003792E4CB
MLHEIDLSRIDLNLLVLFEIVIEERHVGRSAQRLNLSPSAVSHGLGRLRSLLGDPLFLRTPKGVVPTERAEGLVEPIADILSQVRSVVATAGPFDPATSTRRYTIGSPDGVSSVFLPPLLEKLAHAAPGIAVSIRQLLPRQGEPTPGLAWQDAVADLEARVMDVAIIPHDDFPVRFLRHPFYDEDFVIAARAGHKFADEPSLSNYCGLQHLVVSQAGDPYGFVDNVLAERSLSRRVALTVPNFMFALAVLSASDFVSALPRRFVELHAARFGVVGVEAPIPLGCFSLNVVTPQVAMRDAGIAWLVSLLEEVGSAP